jgi:hypothetical protein
LTAKDIIGNRVQLTKWQDDFFAHMVKQFPDIERGESASVTGRRHIPTRVFKQAVSLTKQAEKIRDALDGINPLNVGKKRDEALSFLQKFFPNMERFESQVRKYKREIAQLEKDNATLEKRAEAGEKVSISKQLNENKLRSDYDSLRRFVDSPRSMSGNCFTMWAKKSSCHLVSCTRLPIISFAVNLPSSVIGVKQRCMCGVFSSRWTIAVNILPVPIFSDRKSTAV